MNDDKWQELLYQELSEDKRHMDTMLWEIPTAIFLVDSFLLSLASLVTHFLAQKVIIAFGLSFTIILTWSLIKVIIRSYKRVNSLKIIEEPKKFPRFGEKERWYLRFPLGWLMVLLLIAFISFLIWLLVNPQSLSQLTN